MTLFRKSNLVAVVVLAAITLSGCAVQDGANDSGENTPITTVRLGYFPNLTHAAAIVGVQQGQFKNSLKEIGLTLTPTIFNAGPDAVSALFGNSLDCTYIGPNPTINAYVQSNGEAVRVVAGAASGGAALVVSSDINSAVDLKGKKLATPQLGNTQDVALRHWLKQQGIATTTEGGGDVNVLPQSNAEGLAAFVSGSMDGAWVPEPWVSEYVAAGAKVLVDEATLWPEGQFVTAQIICRTEFIRDYPEAVTALLKAHLSALDSIASDPSEAKASFSLGLQAATGTAPKPEILDAAWAKLNFTYDPISSSLKTSAQEAIDVELLDSGALDAAGGLPGNLYDLAILNSLLEKSGLEPVK